MGLGSLRCLLSDPTVVYFCISQVSAVVSMVPAASSTRRSEDLYRSVLDRFETSVTPESAISPPTSDAGMQMAQIKSEMTSDDSALPTEYGDTDHRPGNFF